MLDCRRCSNTGRALERYANFGPPRLLQACDLLVPVPDVTVPIKTRWAECPDCLGFSAVPLRPKR
jgi:hypothetical protein